ncbi:5'-nucleotidase [Arthroderma uncinatum]|uniref:5'-nucleotidase n=1 Tax=Arthroderma uncinatum TaxID=74035 RepID=UPI00144AC85F|nr:5'-nucleotidase [Arthroderma uncinatum]KAF3482278.1 5'-nucleotidase [Arthroderma uncinatum]
MDAVRHPLFRTQVPLDGRSSVIRSEETNLGNMLADAVRAFYDTDIAFINSGGVRCDRIIGKTDGQDALKVKDIIDIVPFDNVFVVKNIRGSTLLTALENSVSDSHTDGRFLQVSGMRFTASWQKPEGSRVLEAYLQLSRDVPEKIDPERMYTAAMVSFIATGFDGYDCFKDETTLVDAESAMTDTSLMLQVFRHSMSENEVANSSRHNGTNGETGDNQREGDDKTGQGVKRAREAIITGYDDADGLPVISPAIDGRLGAILYPLRTYIAMNAIRRPNIGGFESLILDVHQLRVHPCREPLLALVNKSYYDGGHAVFSGIFNRFKDLEEMLSSMSDYGRCCILFRKPYGQPMKDFDEPVATAMLRPFQENVLGLPDIEPEPFDISEDDDNCAREKDNYQTQPNLPKEDEPVGILSVTDWEPVSVAVRPDPSLRGQGLAIRCLAHLEADLCSRVRQAELNASQKREGDTPDDIPCRREFLTIRLRATWEINGQYWQRRGYKPVEVRKVPEGVWGAKIPFHLTTMTKKISCTRYLDN